MLHLHDWLAILYESRIEKENDCMHNTKRGDIYYADLNPIKGSEQGGEIRPVIVIQNNLGNIYSPTLIVAAVTNRPKPKLPTHVLLDDIDFLERDSIVLLEQIRTIDRVRIGEYIGCLDSSQMKKVDFALAISVGLDK